MDNSPIFIIGNRRSGTTMLRLMLASHPNIGIPPEGGFIIELGWIFGRTKSFNKSHYASFVEKFFELDNAQDWELNKKDLLNLLELQKPITYSEVIQIVYHQYLKQKFPGKRRWGDKTTFYLDFTSTINKFFPSAKFIHIIRDGRDIACSYRKLNHLTHDIRKIALEWTTNIKTAKKAGRFLGKKRYVEIKYENLVNNPEIELKRICSFLNEDYSKEMLDFWKKNKEKKLEPERHMGWKELTIKPVVLNLVGRFKAELSASDIHLFEVISGNTLTSLGYNLITEQKKMENFIETVSLNLFSNYWHFRQRIRGYKAFVKNIRL